jgi:hypothetical protein
MGDLLFIEQPIGCFEIPPVLGLFGKTGCGLCGNGGAQLDCPPGTMYVPKLGMTPLRLCPLDRMQKKAR